MIPIRNFLLQSVRVSPQTRFYAKRTNDPGIRLRKGLLQEKVKTQEEIEDYDDLESDFMSVHKSHKAHVEQMEVQQEKLKYHIVREKYFKEVTPNFLTWHDKEQMKYLHNTDPEEWTIERLAEGFPALPEVIAKIVRAKWTKTNQNKITNHDKNVQENWKLFKKGQLDLPPHLEEHLKKFTTRALTLKPFEMPKDNSKVKFVDKKVEGEFSKIITSYEKLKNKEEEENTEDVKLIKTREFKGKREVTLDHLHRRLESRIENKKWVTEDEEILVSGRDTIKAKTTPAVIEKENKPINLDEVIKNKYENELVPITKTEKDYSHLMYPEKITIPEKLRKKGKLFKVNDCFYDVDGEFLYRVPGMT